VLRDLTSAQHSVLAETLWLAVLHRWPSARGVDRKVW
jgi:hypothetical protein